MKLVEILSRMYDKLSANNNVYLMHKLFNYSYYIMK